VSALQWLVIGGCVVLAACASFELWHVLAGRRDQAVAIARFIPDRVILLRRLLARPAHDSEHQAAARLAAGLPRHAT